MGRKPIIKKYARLANPTEEQQSRYTGAAIRHRRMGMDMSVAFLAAKADCSPKTIYNCEGNGSPISLFTYTKIIKALGLAVPPLT